MSEWTICITAMPTEEALDVAARIADAEEPDCEDLLLTEGARVCDVLRCEVLHQAEVIERTSADLSAATGEVARLSAALAVATRSLKAATTGERLTTCDELARLSREVATVTRERDAALAVITGLREEIADAADTLHRLSLAQQRRASQGSEDARAVGDAYARAAQIVATVGDTARAATVTP